MRQAVREALRRWEARSGPWVHVRPTRAGGAYLVLVLGVLIGAVNTGNNLLYLVLSAMLALLVLSNLLAELNLRGLRVVRVLPDELFAGRAGEGGFLLRNDRRALAAWSVHVEELDGGGAHGLAMTLPPGESLRLPARWTLPSRGRQRLGRLRLWSEMPFGLVRRWIDLPMDEEVLVYPTLGEGRGGLPGAGPGVSREDPRRSGQEGDFHALRAYEPGDPLRDLHWRTTARTGRPMVIQRGALARTEVLVRVEEARGERWERALSAAAGEVERQARRGAAVGLQIGERRFDPRPGDAWRRRLLAELAMAPRR